MPAIRSTRSAADEDGRELLGLANVGPKVCRRFISIGITSVEQLHGRDAVELYEQMQEVAGHPEDPCLLDTVMSAIDQANGNPPRPWWSYTKERKRLLADR